jgi:ferredoxin-type protein NapF
MRDQPAISRRHFIIGQPHPGLRITQACLARMGVVCYACSEACTDGAIQLRPQLGGPPEPVVDRDKCTACGACLAVCPANAIQLATGERRHG